jgi:hypothetical protein
VLPVPVRSRGARARVRRALAPLTDVTVRACGTDAALAELAASSQRRGTGR